MIAEYRMARGVNVMSYARAEVPKRLPREN
jgi:hypothetical protein